MHTHQEKLLQLFLRLAPIEGVPRGERRIADEVLRILRSAGVRAIEDDTAGKIDGDTGNLFCLPESFDANAPSVLLSAHLDTVQSTSSLSVRVTDDRVTSDGTTILGADNRMGLAVLVDLLLSIAHSKNTFKNFFVVFTVCEERGLKGANTLDLSVYPVLAAYVFDCSRRPGVYIREAVGLSVFTAEFVGKAAHAGIAPEEGVSAIALCSNSISKLQLGRIDPETTVNIGTIHGGEAFNIVPERVKIEGEIR